jgi:hypothetical protein
MKSKLKFEFVVNVIYFEIYNEIMINSLPDNGNVMKQCPDIIFQKDSKY